MGYNVHIHVCFSCDTNGGVAALASRHREAVGECQEAQWFLDDLAERTGENPGPKGGLSTWGIVGNYTNGETFVGILQPFWRELLEGVDGGPHSFEHVLVFVESEQYERAMAFEIFLSEYGNPETLTVKKHELPFAWMQM